MSNNVEMLEFDEKGNKYDRKGNPVLSGGKNYKDMSNEVLNYTVDKIPIHYADIYPGPTNVHQNRNLENLAMSYELTGAFIGPKVSPVYTSEKRSDQYFVISRDDVTRNYGLEINRAPGGPATTLGQGFTTQNYSVTNYAGRVFVSDDTINNADEALMLMQRNTKFVQDVIMFAWDQRIANSWLTSAGVSANSVPNTNMTAAGGGQIGSATPTNRYIANAINYAKAQVITNNNGRAPNTIVMSSTVALAIAQSPEIAGQVVFGLGAGYVKDAGWPGAASAAMYGLPDYLYGLRVVVSNLPVNSAPVGQTGSFSELIDDTLSVCIVDEPSRQSQSFLTAFRQGGINVRNYRDFSLNGSYVECELVQVEEATNINGSYALTDCLA